MDLEFAEEGNLSLKLVRKELEALHLKQSEIKKLFSDMDGTGEIISAVSHPSMLGELGCRPIKEYCNNGVDVHVVQMPFAARKVHYLELIPWSYFPGLWSKKESITYLEISALASYEINLSQRKISPFCILKFMVTCTEPKLAKTPLKKEH